ncbi:asparagine synthase (glutamine-hydrolyzing) [Ramlibacter tataouinensis]|uniref:asparagine synthase (glutamine-hydrolyzing) n=1 Tax=Ramlibacter tataouinensis TaxID=94132 RepID=UPI0022F3C242|nr:asparagine synthase (glutamine-hydrolyzing) [Ramlibacter tataouinensis]WBY00720.1 asparagine synthase (glutamine-hydrolyzing) [Ramlibacter tataouinensis]
MIAPRADLPDHVVIAMRDRLAHRGPDGHGLEIRHTSAMSVALAHRRLSIVDLSEAASQPMASADGRQLIAFNGEIYNFVELRKELEAQGETFRSRSDTEVLLAAYRRWGPDCLQRLNGMFAFAVWDEVRQQVFIARDRFGEKPLFFARPAGGGIAFASEIKALLAHPGIALGVDTGTLERYAAGQYHEDGEATLFDGVRRVPPATALLLDTDSRLLRQWRYWTPDYTQVDDGLGLESASDRFLELLQESIRKRLRADVPVGSSLSGGLDSSMIVCTLADMRTKGAAFEQHTFSARFDQDPTLSEGEYIDMVVERTGVHPHAVSPDPATLMAESRLLHWHQEEPFLSASIYLQWCVARLAREHRTTVLLDGQGADEVLAGYQYYFRTHQLDLADRLQLRELLRTTQLFNSRLRVASDRYANSRRRFNHQIAMSVPQLLRSIVRPSGLYAGPYEVGVPPPRRGQRLRRQLAEALQYNSLPQLLRYADRNAMAFGREGRLPFLDYDLVDWCIRLPDRAWIHDGWQKYVMRSAGEGLLPPAVQWRADKVGYAAPLDVWLRGPLKEWGRDRLFDTRLSGVPGYDRAALEATWNAHQASESDSSWAIWRWISLSEWLGLHADGSWRHGA